MPADRPESSEAPWYRRARRWGQTNLTEIDPLEPRLEFWRPHWRRTRVQGVIVNAGGIVAYYPSAIVSQYRAEHLGETDLFGLWTDAAREEGLAVLARMDSNRISEPAFAEHPEWAARDRDGNAVRAGDRYITCVNSPYYKQAIPDILREVIDRYRPDGFTDNSWTGLGRRHICHCDHCARGFHEATGLNLPVEVDWTDEAYRRWIDWSYRCRYDNWVLNNEVTRATGGEHCLWLGMLHGDPIRGHVNFADLHAIGKISRIIMTDQQSRDAANGFEQNSLTGRLLHEVSDWSIVIPESMAMYVRGKQPFRKASAPPAEARTWMLDGIAGGISPWWHHIGADHDDRRQYATAEPVTTWHAAVEHYLYDREPMARVALGWSHANTDFYGRDDAAERVALPWRGWTWTLTRARIPFLPVHLDELSTTPGRFDLIVLADVAAMSDAQLEGLRRGVGEGAALIVSGASGLLDEWGEPRESDPLADLIGAERKLDRDGQQVAEGRPWERHSSHSYLRFEPGAFLADAFADAAVIPSGGAVQQVGQRDGVATLATWVPPFPVYPPEFSWVRTSTTDTPLVLAHGRVIYMAGDLDRCAGRYRLPDHAELLEALVRHVAPAPPIEVEGPGYLDCQCYRQEQRLILHVVNLSGTGTWPGYLEEHLPVGPLRVRVRLPEGVTPRSARGLVSGDNFDVERTAREIVFTLESVSAHELVVIE